MYKYDEIDRAVLDARTAEFREQVHARLSGALSEDEFKPLRLMNGVYLQLHAYMLRVAIPYGVLSSEQLRSLAYVARTYDRGYGHFTTRQNLQYNWPNLRDVPDMLDALGKVGLHAIQTSGNTVRNVTSDPYAGAAADEVVDPRPYAELLRQWSTDHPEFQFLGRKFKIAITGAEADRAVIRAHDIGLQLHRQDGELGVRVLVGGGLGRTPMLAKTLRDFLPVADLLPYVEAVLSVYNLLGRRDNKYKARIKILVHEEGLERIRDLVEDRFARIRETFSGVDTAILDRIQADFAPPAFRAGPEDTFDAAYASDPLFRSWVDTNTRPHKAPGHVIAEVSLKPHGATPGDASGAQMRVLAHIAETYGYDELRISQDQNVILPHLRRADLPAVFAELRAAGLATANIGQVSDIVACPGMDYCALATARSIPVAQKIATRFAELGLEEEIGAMRIKISGCINACAHHHLGHIGILGLDRAGVETYQITLGGDGTETAAIGERAGPGFSYDEIVPAIERLVRAYLDLRDGSDEPFLATLRRLGAEPFRAALYPQNALAAE